MQILVNFDQISTKHNDNHKLNDVFDTLPFPVQ